MIPKRTFAFALAALSLTGAGAARADAPSTFGLGARSASLARADVAYGDPLDATRMNAANAAESGAHVRLGYGYGALNLAMNGRSAGVTRASGLHLAAQYGGSFGRFDVGIAFSLYAPDHALARVAFRPATEPQFVLYEAPLQRLAADVVVAARYGPISVGLGVAFGLSVGGDGTRFGVGQDAKGVSAEASADVSLPYKVAPIVGVRADFKRVAVGLSYRGPIGINLALDSAATVAIANNPLNGNTTVRVHGTSGYDPGVLTFGARALLVKGISVMASIDYTFHRATPPPVADVIIDLELGTTPGLREGHFTDPRFRDTLTPRVAVEWRPPIDPPWGWCLAARAGYAFLPTPVPKQTGFTTFLDASRHVIAVGGGYHLGKLAGVDFSIDAAGQLHLLVPRETEKGNLGLPYARHRASGNIVYGTATLEAAW